MIVDACQRWRDQRGTYRPAGEAINTARYEVAPITGDSEAKAFVLAHHYSGSYPAARFRHGLYRGGQLVGVAVFSVPANNRALSVLPGEPLESVELGRFVLLDDVPANGETWFLGRAFELLRREGLVGVVSFSDPSLRHSSDGRLVFGGHVGTIYQAFNGVYRGRSKAETQLLLPDGRVLHRRALSKIRKRDRGWKYSAALLEAAGAPGLGLCDPKAWLDVWLPRLTRARKHPGNHRYVWGLTRRAQRHLPASLPYPKLSTEPRRAA
jgi:hypothetical protein